MIRNCLFLATALITTVATSMEPGSLSAAQHISLLRSFLTVTDFKVTKEGKITYPHYQDKTQVYIQDRHDATLILWQAKDDTTIMNKGGSLTLELYSRLDRSQPLEPQLSDTEKLSLHQFLFHRFFARKDIDMNDDIAVTPHGAKIITTAQQKHARAEAKKALEDFLMELSESSATKTPAAPKIEALAPTSLEDYLKKAFAVTSQMPQWMIYSFGNHLYN